MAVSGAVSIFAWAYFKSVGYAAVSFLSGIAIDLDHLFDYFKNHGFTTKWKDIYDACVRTDFAKLYLLAHSYELLALLWGSIALLSLGNFWKAIAIGVTQHLVFDQLTNPIREPGYFFVYRALKKFDKDSLVKKERF